MGTYDYGRDTVEVMMRWFMALASTAIVGLCTWVFVTHAQVEVNKETLESRERSVEAIPHMKTDIEVIKNEQAHLRQDVDDIGKDVKAILRAVRPRDRANRDLGSEGGN